MTTLVDSYKLVAVVNDERGTAQVAHIFAQTVKPGAVLILTGDLGAGKTTLMKYLGKALGIDPSEVRSPTFTLVHEYRHGTMPLVHMDVYRLPDPEEFEAMGGLEYLDTNRGLVAIEWGEQIMSELDADWLQLKLVLDSGSGRRSFFCRTAGPVSEAWLQRIVNRLSEEGEA